MRAGVVHLEPILLAAGRVSLRSRLGVKLGAELHRGDRGEWGGTAEAGAATQSAATMPYEK